MAICTRWKGDRKAAMTMLQSATSAGSEVSYNMGIIEIQNGNYGAAVSNFGSANSFNVALAKLLNGNPDACIESIDKSKDNDAAISFYLKAIAGARQGNPHRGRPQHPCLRDQAPGCDDRRGYREDHDMPYPAGQSHQEENVVDQRQRVAGA